MKMVLSVMVDCPVCGGVMWLVNTIPALGALAEVRSYKCEGCNEIRATTFDRGSRREVPFLDLAHHGNDGASGKEELTDIEPVDGLMDLGL